MQRNTCCAAWTLYIINEYIESPAPSDIKVRYVTDDDDGIKGLWLALESDMVAMLELEEPLRDSLMTVIEKYVQWNLKASKMKVEIQKDIAEYENIRTLYMTPLKEAGIERVTLKIKFFSLDKEKHILILKVENGINPANILLQYNEAKELLSMLKRTPALKAERDKSEAVAKEFN